MLSSKQAEASILVSHCWRFSSFFCFFGRNHATPLAFSVPCVPNEDSSQI
jgi:hypothetical protein